MTTNGGRRAGWRGFGVAGALPHDVIRTLAAAAERLSRLATPA